MRDSYRQAEVTSFLRAIRRLLRLHSTRRGRTRVKVFDYDGERTGAALQDDIVDFLEEEEKEAETD